jgi:hypothetical protein
MENESGGRGLTIMWSSFIRKKRQSPNVVVGGQNGLGERRYNGDGTCGEDADSLFQPSSEAPKNQERKYVIDNQLKQCR